MEVDRAERRSKELKDDDGQISWGMERMDPKKTAVNEFSRFMIFYDQFQFQKDCGMDISFYLTLVMFVKPCRKPCKPCGLMVQKAPIKMEW